MEPSDVVILEGILVLHMQEIRDLCHMKVCVGWWCRGARATYRGI